MKDAQKYYEVTKESRPHKLTQKFINMKIIPDKAIDLGCGAGRDTVYLIKNGWKVLAIDKENSKEYVTIKNDLVVRCENFIKDCENGNIVEYETLPELADYEKYAKRLKWYQQIHENVRVKAKKNIYESEDRYREYDKRIQQLDKEREKLIEENEKLKTERNQLQEKYEQKNRELEQVYQSKGWKTLEKLRNVKEKFKK